MVFTNSEKSNDLLGVPQKSILRPIFFNIYLMTCHLF